MATRKSPSFFEKYPHEYDFLTDAKTREIYHRKEVASIFKRFTPDAVLDAGCASGLTSRLFAEQGVTTVGLDRSRGMIQVALQSRGDKKQPLTFTVGQFEKLPKRFRNRFDLVVCLANSISGVGTIAGLKTALMNFRDVLKPGGHLILQALNYTSIKEHQLFPIRATENVGIVYERFSERRGSSFFIYVTRLDTNTNPPSLEIFRHQLDNFTVDQLARSVNTTGLTLIGKFADLYFKKRFGKKSRDLVLVARKKA